MNSSGGAWVALGRTGLPPVAGPLESPAAPTRVLILGDDALARAALAGQLAVLHQVAIVADRQPAAAAEAVDTEEPDVALWDLGLHSSQSLAALREWEGGIPVLALGGAGFAAADAFAAGARGVLPRDAPPARLAAALVALAEGLWVLEDGAAGALLRGSPAPQEPSESLTPREREVVGLLGLGLSNKAIGERLGISEHTAKFHVNSILGKLGAAGRTDAVMRAVRLGLILV